MRRFLIRSWVFSFYKTYSGLLFVLFLLGTGFLKAEEHITLAYFFTGQLKNLLFPAAGFILYEVLTIHFSKKWISQNRNQTIREIVFLGFWHRLTHLMSVIIYLQLPVIVYTAFLLYVSLISDVPVVFLAILIFAFIRLVLYCLIVNRAIIFPVEKQFKTMSWLHLPSIPSLLLIKFSFRYIFQQKLLSFTISKVISIGILLLFYLISDTIDYYHRFSSVAIFTVFVANTLSPFLLFEFHNIDLNSFRSLPLKPYNLLFQTFIVLLILNLPEITILYKNFSKFISVGYIGLNVMMGIGFLLLWYTYLVYSKKNLQKYIIRIFWGSLLILFLLFFDVPVYLIVPVLLSLIFYLYFKGFYAFEMIYKEVKDK